MCVRFFAVLQTLVNNKMDHSGAWWSSLPEVSEDEDKICGLSKFVLCANLKTDRKATSRGQLHASGDSEELMLLYRNHPLLRLVYPPSACNTDLYLAVLPSLLLSGENFVHGCCVSEDAVARSRVIMYVMGYASLSSLKANPVKHIDDRTEEAFRDMTAGEEFLLTEANIEEFADAFSVEPKFIESYRSIDNESLLSIATQLNRVEVSAALLRIAPSLVGVIDRYNGTILNALDTCENVLMTRVFARRFTASASSASSASDNHDPAILALMRVIAYGDLIGDPRGLSKLHAEALDIASIRRRIGESAYSSMAAEVAMITNDQTRELIAKLVAQNNA